MTRIAVPGEVDQWRFDVSGTLNVGLDVGTIIGDDQQLSFTLVSPEGRIVLRQVADSETPDGGDTELVSLDGQRYVYTLCGWYWR